MVQSLLWDIVERCAEVFVSFGKYFGRIIKIHKLVYNLSLSPLVYCPLGYC